MDNSLLLAAVPLILSGTGWTVYKVIVHDTCLSNIKDTLNRLEGKVDRLIERGQCVNFKAPD